MVCIDTSILIDILREDKNTKELEEYLDRQSKFIASPQSLNSGAEFCSAGEVKKRRKR